MRRLLPAIGLFSLVAAIVVSTLSAEPPKDTALADKTRATKLKTKITLSFKNEMLREVLKEISGELEGKKIGSLSFRYDNPVNMNVRVSVDAKEKAVEDILDEMFKPLNYGYYVVSKTGDREDGFIRVNTNAEDRGYKKDENSKTTTKKEDDKKEDLKDKKKEEKKEPKKDANKEEIAAKGKLGLAQNYLDAKKTEKGKMVLEDLIKLYPNTKAAEEAKDILEKLNK